MPNDVKLQEGHPVDENLRPLKVGGKSTAIETAQHGNGVRINGDLEVTDNIECNVFATTSTDINIPVNIGLTFGDAGEYIHGNGTDLYIVSGRHIAMAAEGSFYLDSTTGQYYFRDNADSDDHFKITTVSGTGATTLETVSAAADGDLSVVADGSITLNSGTGAFEMHGTGTTPKFADMYAGMILGYTVIGLDATPASYSVTNAMVPVHDDLKVSFVFPPSGKVEISVSVFNYSNGSRPLTFGLSTASNTAGFASLGAEYENVLFSPDETDGYQVTARWYVTGTAGDSEELWLAAGSTAPGRNVLYWGGDSSSVADSTHPMEYQPFTMKATALPATIYTG